MWGLECICRKDDDDCAGCSEYRQLHSILHRELNLESWQWPAVIAPDDLKSVYPPESASAAWHAHGRKLYRQLAKASGLPL
jgi:hypothetical protein